MRKMSDNDCKIVRIVIMLIIRIIMAYFLIRFVTLQH